MNELALFAGAGGGILGGHLLGWRTVCAVENEPYAISVLLQRQNDKVFPTFPIWDDICTFDGKPWRGIVDVVSGGFPCQDISAAGKGAGIKGKRSGLWSEMARVIGEVKPEWVFAENSPMLVSRGLNIVLSDLAQMGFNARWGCISAAEIGANHKRNRIWIVARNMAYTRCKHGSQGHSRTLDKNKAIRPTSTIHTQSGSEGFCEDVADTESIKCNERQTGNLSEKNKKKGLRGEIGTSCNNVADTDNRYRTREIEGILGQTSRQTSNRLTRSSKDVADTDSERGCLRQTIGQDAENARQSSRGTKSRNWDIEPDVGRVVNWMAARTHRLKAIGNGQVPEVVRVAWETLSKDL